MAGGPLFTARGLSLASSIGPWGVAILGAVAALAVYGYFKKSQDDFDQSETDAEIKDALG